MLKMLVFAGQNFPDDIHCVMIASILTTIVILYVCLSITLGDTFSTSK